MSTAVRDAAAPFVLREVERTVLGYCLVNSANTAAFLEEGVRAAQFYSHHDRLIWSRLEALARAGEVADYNTVLPELVKRGELEDVRHSYLIELMAGTGHGPAVRAAVAFLARQLLESAVGRETLALLDRARTRLEQAPASLSEGFYAQLDGSLRSLSGQLRGRRLPEHLSHLGEVMAEVRQTLESGPPTFVDTPWPALNTMLGGGFAPGELVFLGARPGLGKTAMAIDIARRTGTRGQSVFVVSREMLTVAIGLRLLSQEGPVNATYLRKRGELLTPHWRTIDVAIEHLEALPIFLTHARVTVEDIRKLVGMLMEEAPLGLVVVDYLQLIDAPPGVNERRLQVEAVSAGLKALTLDYEVPVLCLSSLARPPENRPPTLASLRESGNLEHDADTVILLHRPEVQPQTDVIVAKSRNGRTGKLSLYFRGEYQRFEEQDGSRDDES